MVLHASADTAPHILIHLAVYAVSLWTQRREIDIAASRWVDGGKDVVIHGVLIKISIFAVVRCIEKCF